ncbi:uncharacterized protein LOC105185961 isoform X1 [Harpegnathos saltator]|uniref:uncharacterized protein LOC105185961 isoform X1 n=1 Tax=Harpegnathos saltator TaxID=610380 RepID=UPI00058B7F5E|nr:uncharacterized protein LOC105185961 isoform X1 [Harpegnathos saltator]XP_019698262.1 uncharacterized protein LOC105185961 isoform X1 [Harpegnathos saltator]XP_019698263.1 uncharacterized protein LOC105185961 isoform X1 [Harpegnathos saltator]XP_025152895.1 uncharacterized protein LOC105185961 isoform X1 [Harpegnathos saltator]XP_025152896.1 uncharacterized protein LOC105185961 isoform X1 [Harpegnathos saltator]XP_025152897.1 uncharacterized protein LOC105185961 isoform X1 [Harpegnathos sal
MKPYEMQMILFTKSCFICHEQYNLQTCTECYSVNYCLNHVIAMRYHKFYNCAKLKSCLETDQYLHNVSLFYNRFIDVDYAGIHNVVNMQQFAEKFMTFQSDHLKKFYSDYLSGPLTLHYGIMNDYLHIQDSHYVVHIIYANVLDAQYILAWEIMLHILPAALKHLEVVLVGSEMQAVHINVELCSRCKQLKKKFGVQSYRISFYDYVNIMLPREPPNVIIAFEADISEWDLRAKIISKLNSQSCPLIVTTGSYAKFQRNRQELSKIARAPLNLISIENKFSSLRAYRNLENSDVSNRNQFLIIFRSLRGLFNSYNESVNDNVEAQFSKNVVYDIS